MYRVTNFAGDLPPEYELWEDGRNGFVLNYHGEWIACFSPHATVEEIQKAVREHAASR